ncbi:MAG: hypothetical protein MUP22_14360 [Desulfobacterales bacterium]|nr:hypothetical protein [Desulfobacterales bacterium]
MVNLEKISDLLEKGVENPAVQSDEGKFSARKWKKEVQEHTEPLLRVITERLNEAVTEEKNFWQGNKFKILKKLQGKQIRTLSLQDARCKLPEPFAFTTGDDNRRSIEAFMVLGPSASSIAEKYKNCVLWGLRWWGTTKIARTAYDRFDLINQDVGFTLVRAKDKTLGGSYVWLFNSMTAKALIKTGIESIADIVTKDFLKLSSILSKNKDLFPPPPPIKPVKNPTRDDVGKAVLRIWSSTGQTRINKSDVLKAIESEVKKKGVTLDPGWRSIIEGRLEDWFG